METIKQTGPEITDSELDGFEQVLERPLPSDYRCFLTEYNGGMPTPRCFDFGDGNPGSDVLLFYSLGGKPMDDIRHQADTFEDRVPSQLLPIGCDSFGNQICLGLEGDWRGRIYFWDHELASHNHEQPNFDNITFVSDSFQELLDSLYEF